MEMETRKQEVARQVIAYFLAVLLLTTILSSVGESWGIVSIPVKMANILIGGCVIYSCYKFSYFIARPLVMMAKKIIRSK